MHHKFDVKSFAKLDNPERRKSLPADAILHKFDLEDGDVVADVGCGIGYFTFPASSVVGLTGKVLAMDISDEMIEQVRDRAKLCGVTNIETIKIDEQNFLLPDGSVDVEIVFFVLHEAQNALQFIFELNRILKPGGKLALIDWEKKEMPQGPPVTHRIDRQEVISLLAQARFIVKTVDVGEDFYGLLAIKPV
ncbi:class I SAM-dependent methyltransferase [Pelorhabdus rhamnosifermentans]|uniref:class I SAM-dependent methyltransferase n=1 Tax=Pelorhabdus rhamnosifermentans TaxID=2772457 RepID=UPI001C061DF6|nr:class I SAM-dependent methyltransferase [Pelorhabdus rhamnosifermentans]